MTDGIVKVAVDKLEELALQELSMQWAVGKKVRDLRDDLDWLRAFLGHADQLRRQQANQYIELWVRQTRDVAFDAEDLLDEYFHRGRLHCHGVINLPSLLEWFRRSTCGLFVRHSICSDIDAIMKRLDDIKNRREQHNLHNLPSTWAPRQRNYSQWSMLVPEYVDEKDSNLLVRIREPYTEIHGWLTKNYAKQRTVIAITGESGVGKTTFAKCISKRNLIREWFCVIWVDVPQHLKLVELLGNIIKQATGAMEETIAMDCTEEEIKDQLKEKLSGRRYLIVLDNVRTLEELKFFLAVLPEEGIYGNRVLITTQMKFPGVSSKKDEEKYGKSSLCTHKLELQKLNMSQGKELFCKRVFGEKDFPEDTVENAKNVDKLLHGLPQSITLLAGLLRSKKEDEWPNVVNRLMHCADQINPQEIQSIQCNQPSMLEKILMLSFDDLPPHLKQCFLYLAAFNAEVGINCQKLVQLWVAEGFVQPSNGWLTMEECGQKYLKKLISRCLINLVEKDYSNNVVTISIHENVLAFARSEAREANFLQVQNRTTNLTNPSIRRLSLHTTFGPHTSLNLSAPKLRSLLCDDSQQATSSTTHRSTCSDTSLWSWIGRMLLEMATELIMGGDVASLSVYQCKFLRVMDLKGTVHCVSLPNEIGWLIHLRYLGLSQTRLTSLPSSVSKLHNLQTLDITKTNINQVPNGFWKIQVLRHVLAQDLKNGPNNVYALCNLHTLLGVPWGRWAKKGASLKRLTNLRSLQLLNLSTEQDSRDLLDALGSLESLTSLELEGSHLPLDELLTVLFLRRLQHIGLHGPVAARCVVEESSHWYLLPNLTKLELYRTEISPAQLDAIANLPNLSHLMLEEGSYLQKAMVIPDGGFPELRKLQLKKLHELETWSAPIGGSALNKLQQISIYCCARLKMNFEHLKTLEHLMLLGIYNCPQLLVPANSEFVLRNKLLIEVPDSSMKNKATSIHA